MHEGRSCNSQGCPAERGYVWCERCGLPLHHEQFVWRFCCKECCRSGVCEADCVSWNMAVRSQSQWFRGRLELYEDPHNGRLWVCKAKTCHGCVYPWLYLDTVVQSNGRATEQIAQQLTWVLRELERHRGLALRWLAGELQIWYDRTKQLWWICPAQRSEGSLYPWLYVGTLLQLQNYMARRGQWR